MLNVDREKEREKKARRACGHNVKEIVKKIVKKRQAELGMGEADKVSTVKRKQAKNNALVADFKDQLEKRKDRMRRGTVILVEERR